MSSYAIGLQVVILLCRTVKKYIDILPSDAACYCVLATGLSDTALYTGTVYSCECRVPGTDDTASIMTSHPSAVTAVRLQIYIIIYKLVIYTFLEFKNSDIISQHVTCT